MRPKGNTIVFESKVAEAVTRLLNKSSKSQFEITNEIGLGRSNIMTMFKQGRTKLPIRLVVPLAEACEADPAELMMIVLEEYHPEILQALGESFGIATTEDEQAVLGAFRRAKANKEKRKQAAAKKNAKNPTEERQANLIRAEVNLAPEVIRGLHDYIYNEMLK